MLSLGISCTGMTMGHFGLAERQDAYLRSWSSLPNDVRWQDPRWISIIQFQLDRIFSSDQPLLIDRRNDHPKVHISHPKTSHSFSFFSGISFDHSLVRDSDSNLVIAWHYRIDGHRVFHVHAIVAIISANNDRSRSNIRDDWISHRLFYLLDTIGMPSLHRSRIDYHLNNVDWNGISRWRCSNLVQNSRSALPRFH